MNKTRGYWNPLNNTILVDWDGEGNIIKEYPAYVYPTGEVTIYPYSGPDRGLRVVSFRTLINRNDPDFESKLDAWVRNNRGLLR